MVTAVYAHYAGLNAVQALFYGIAPQSWRSSPSPPANWSVSPTAGTGGPGPSAWWSSPSPPSPEGNRLTQRRRRPADVALDARRRLHLPRRRTPDLAKGTSTQGFAAWLLASNALGTMAFGGTLVPVGLFFLKRRPGLRLRPGRRPPVARRRGRPAPLADPGTVPGRRGDGADHPRPVVITAAPSATSSAAPPAHSSPPSPSLSHLPRRRRPRPLVHPPPRQPPAQGVRHRRHRRHSPPRPAVAIQALRAVHRRRRRSAGSAVALTGRTTRARSGAGSPAAMPSQVRAPCVRDA